jgi:hypothetical protein
LELSPNSTLGFAPHFSKGNIKMSDLDTWKMEDYRQGLCSIHDVGTIPKKTNITPITPWSVIEEVPARRLKKDVMAAYEALGGMNYLIDMGKKDPANFNKLLAKVLPQAIEADVRHEAIGPNMEIMPTHQLKRLFVKLCAEKGVIIDTDVVETTTNDNK